MSATRLLAIKTLDFIKECIVNGDCSDDELRENISRLSHNTIEGSINKNDYVNVDVAMSIIGTKNRTKFYEIARKYGIVNHTMNNQHIGFKRNEIEAISYILKEEKTTSCCRQ